MAERYGGKYSAGGKTDNARAAPASPLKGRKSGPANLMFIAPLALIWRAFTSEPVQLAQYLVALGLLLLAAWLTRLDGAYSGKVEGEVSINNGVASGYWNVDGQRINF